MNTKFCSLCGREGSAEKTYCIECGGLLTEAVIKNSDGESASNPTRLPRPDPTVVKKAGYPRHSRFGFLKFLFLITLSALIVAGYFAAKDPKIAKPPATPPIPNAPLLVERALSRATVAPSGLSQSVINAFLELRGRLEWKCPIEKMPMPQWKGSRVELQEGEFSYDFEVTIIDHPVYFHELFRLLGTAGQWNIEPVSGSIGCLAIAEPFLKPFTSLVLASTVPLKHEIDELSQCRSLQIHPGLLEFTK